jgi:hypothetical protein
MKELTLEEVNAMRHKLQVRENFDKKYAYKGGVEKLLELAETDTQWNIGAYFGLRPQRVAKIYHSITGQDWPRRTS